MPVRFRCPHCNRKLSISRRYSGREVACPSCGETLQVPEEAETTSQAAQGADVVQGESAPPVPPPVSADAGIARKWRRRSLDWDEEMDLTPMVDVTFLLLIFFMVTASYSIQKTITVPRPDPEQEGVQQQPRELSDLENSNIIVEVASDNTILVDGTATPVLELVGRIESLRNETGKTELLITAAGDAYHETVVAVIDAANLVGIGQVRIAQTITE